MAIVTKNESIKVYFDRSSFLFSPQSPPEVGSVVKKPDRYGAL
jgi:hypothetical protein